MSATLRRRCRTALAALLVVTGAGAGAGFAGAGPASSGPPQVGLLAAAPHVEIQRVEGAGVHLDLGVFLAARGGTLRIDVVRDGWSSTLHAVQKDRDGGVVRTLPAGLVRSFAGFHRFLRVAFSRDGAVAAQRVLTVCPNGWERQRLDDSGPTEPTFPESCTHEHFPFTRSSVWGVDQGWAVGLVGDVRQRPFDVPAGEYDVTVEILPDWADALGVKPGDRAVRLTATVVEVALPEPRPPDDPAAMSAATAPGRGPAGAPSASPAAGARQPLLPDLAALPAWRIEVQREDGRDHLSFAATPWNAGPGPFVLEGFRRGDGRVMDAFQYLYDGQGRVVGRAPAGEMAYHAGGGHDHWHFLQFAAFDLLTLEGRPAAPGLKQGFCLATTDAVDLAAPGAQLRPYANGPTSSCGGARALWVREVLPAGWGDTYFNVSGQAFDVTDLPNGRYLLRVRVDPLRQLTQVRTDNDEASREVELGGRPGARTVTVAPWNGIRDQRAAA